MPISDRLLMGPGPSNPYPEVAQALAGPVLGHLDPEFLAILDATNERLRQVFATANPLTLPVSGTGSAGMETSFVNFVRAGDPVVVGVNGVFGERMCEVADRLGAQVIRVDAPWGTPIAPDALLSAHPDPSLIAVVHAETSTGVRNDVAALGAQKGNALLLVDMVTSLGGIEVLVDAWGVDIAYSGTQKCLGVPPGLSPLTVSERARERMVERPSSWYLDLNLLSRYVQGSEGGRVYHHTAPVTMVAALHAGLGAILDEGLDAARARHAACGQLLQDGLEALGLQLFAQADHRLPQLTTVEIPARLPDGMTEADCRRTSLAPLRHRDRRRGRAVGGQGVADRLHGPHGPSSQRPGVARCIGGGARRMNAARAVRHAPLALHGQRVMLRPLTEHDFDEWHEVRTRCGAWLLRWEPRPKGAPVPSEDRPSFAARCGIRERERHLGSGYGFGIFVGERFAGEVTLSSIQRGPFQSGCIGYWIDEALAGRGFVPESVVVTLRFAFEAISLHRVEISIIPRNTASRRVVREAGHPPRRDRRAVLGDRRGLGGPRALRHHLGGMGGARAGAGEGVAAALESLAVGRQIVSPGIARAPMANARGTAPRRDRRYRSIRSCRPRGAGGARR